MNGRKRIDLTGRRFGKLTVIGRAPNQIHLSCDGHTSQRSMWFCQCECGSPVKAVRTDHLWSGRVVSCGCHKAVQLSEERRKHNQSKSRLYGVWCNMKNRCYNPNVRSYKNYGAIGITVCDEWKNDFVAFRDWAYANGYKDDAEYMKCTIDRIDNDGPYAPWNCRFVDAKVQANNRGHSIGLETMSEREKSLLLEDWGKGK